MILDTSYLIDLIQGDEEAVKKAKELEKNNINQKISSVTLFELHNGIKQSSKPKDEKEKVKEVLDSKNCIEAGEKIMRKAGKINGRLLNEGDRIETFDSMIAATAVIKGEKVLTRNTKHFERIENLEVENY